jgi:MFS family permease
MQLVPVKAEQGRTDRQTELPSIAYAWYAVIALTTCYTLSFIDRQILALLVGPIKRDLAISDTRFSLLHGLAFAVFYTFLGLPLGRLADTRNRRNVIAVGVLVWSVMTGLCSTAKSFWSLFLARVGVGVGEATLGPAAMSTIADTFPKERLSRALSVYSMGVFIGSGLALVVGGTVVQMTSQMAPMNLPLLGTVAPWRLTFLIAGLPGLVVALWVLTLREPARRTLLRQSDGRASRLSVGEVGGQLRQRWQSFTGITVAMIFHAMVVYGFSAWAPAFFQRVHDWNARQAGQTLGLMILICGCLGLYVGGSLSDHWRKRGIADGPLKVLMIGATGMGILFVPAFIIKNASVSAGLMAPAVLFMGMSIGCAFASLQLIFPNQARGQISALYLFIISLGGLTLGPLLPALLNDYVFKSERMIGTSMAITLGVASALMVLIVWSVCAPYRRHCAELEQVTSELALPRQAGRS